MQVKGYTLYENSRIEGCLSDLIFINQTLFGNTEIHCEVKWDIFSLGKKIIRKEFNKYLLLYLRLPHTHKFRFMIFSREIANRSSHLSIFEKYNEKEIKKLIEKINKDLDGDDKEFFQEVLHEDIKAFLADTTLVTTDFDGLNIKISQELGTYPLEFTPFLKYINLEDDYEIEFEIEDKIVTNLIKINGFKKIWLGITEYSSDEEIRREIQHHPPYVLYEHKIVSLYNLDENNVLSDFVDIGTIEEHNVSEWIEDKDKRRVIIWLLNRSINKLCQLRGLYRKRNESIYYFPNIARNLKEKIISWTLDERFIGFQKQESKRQVYKKYAEESNNPYFLHSGIEVSAIFFHKKLYYYFRSSMVFTGDGVNLVDSDRAYDLKNNFRDPNMGRSRNKYLEQMFFFNWLFKEPNKPYIEEVLSEREKVIRKETKRLLRALKIKDFDYFVADFRPIIDDDLVL